MRNIHDFASYGNKLFNFECDTKASQFHWLVFLAKNHYNLRHRKIKRNKHLYGKQWNWILAWNED